MMTEDKVDKKNKKVIVALAFLIVIAYGLESSYKADKDIRRFYEGCP